MFLRLVYDEKLAQAAYLIGCQRTGAAIIIDPQRDVDRYLSLAQANGLKIVAVAETHIHADFLSGARELAQQVGARVYLSDEGDQDWKYQWLDQKVGGGGYDHHLLHDGDTFSIGNIDFAVVHTPGHTPEHLVYLVTDRGSGADAPIGLITGDFVLVGDLGRPDLLETAVGKAGAMVTSARQLYRTLDSLAEIPDFVQIWPAHGAGSACGKAVGAVPTSTMGYERRFNPAIGAATSEDQFLAYILQGQPEPPLYFARMKRDNMLGPPILGGVPQPPQLTAEVVFSLNPKTVAIIDTRPWGAFQEGHVPRSMSLPLNRAFNTNAGSLVREDEAIVLIVEPARIDEAVRDLIRVGLDNITGWLDPVDLRSDDTNDAALATLGEVTVAEAIQLLDEGLVHVLDVRRATEFDQGHLPGAINIAHTRLADRLDELARDKPLLVNCQAGGRSAVSCAFLQRLGFETLNLSGGILAWDRR